MKKYYHKLTLSLVDTAMVNGWIHYDLIHDPKGWNARVEFTENCAEEFITTDWEMAFQSNSGMVTQTGSAGNIITMMGVTKNMNGGNADDDFNDFTIGAGGGITSSVITCVPVSLGAGEGQYRIPAGKRATNNQEMFKAPSRDGSTCMVCKYEERGRGARVSVCLTHGIRACLVAQPNRQSVKPLMKQGTKDPANSRRGWDSNPPPPSLAFVENQWSYTTKATSRTFSAECPAGGLSGIRPLILNSDIPRIHLRCHQEMHHE
jgi:hypothetical protein